MPHSNGDQSNSKSRWLTAQKKPHKSETVNVLSSGQLSTILLLFWPGSIFPVLAWVLLWMTSVALAYINRFICLCIDVNGCSQISPFISLIAMLLQYSWNKCGTRWRIWSIVEYFRSRLKVFSNPRQQQIPDKVKFSCVDDMISRSSVDFLCKESKHIDLLNGALSIQRHCRGIIIQDNDSPDIKIACSWIDVMTALHIWLIVSIFS